MVQNFKVVTCTPSSNDGYIVTIEGETTVNTPLGKMIKPFGKRYLSKVVDEVPVGKTVQMDLADFDIREDTFIGDDGEEHTVYWINPK